MATRITEGFMKAIRPKIEEALELVGEEFEVEFETARATYNENWFEMKIKCKAAGGLTREQTDYDNRRARIGLPPRGNTVHLNGVPYEIYGWKVSARKYKIIVIDRRTGERLKCTPWAIINSL